MFLLMQNPSAYTRLKEEVRTVFKYPEDISSQHTEQLDYLQAIINEGLRLVHPGPGALPRVATVHSTIDGYGDYS